MKLTLCIPNEEFEKDHPVAAQTIEYFVIVSGISCVILVFLSGSNRDNHSRLSTDNLAVVPLPRMWTASSRALLMRLLFRWITIILYGPAKKNKAITQATPV
ncbi:hypothetical protein Ddc_10516 [Ditylenchus destructor]|nr:hypothetical protein Ddc_10516 [Ditylenchus destructor]